MAHGGTIFLRDLAVKADSGQLTKKYSVMFGANVLNSSSKPTDIDLYRKSWIFTASRYYEETGIDISAVTSSEKKGKYGSGTNVGRSSAERSAMDFM